MGDKVSIYIDLDGPILDVSERYYRVHNEIMSELGAKNKLTRERYWQLKRDKAPLNRINRELVDDTAIKYRKKWLEYIEQKRFLVYDRVWPCAKAFLKKISADSNLILVTARMHSVNLFWELRQKGLLNYFRKVYVADPAKGSGGKEKLIKRDKYFGFKNSFIIGDTEVDIICGKNCGLATVAFLNGIRSDRSLLSLKPDICIKRLKEFLEKYKGRCLKGGAG